MRRVSLALIATVLALAATVPVTAATITIVNQDSAGVGLNDPTPAAPIGGNPGTTIGAQRLNVFKEAARIWGEILPSSVEIRVDASFTPLSCNTTSAVLGGAAPLEVFSDFSGALIPGTWYVGALADKLSGTDQEPSESDIEAYFNSNLGSSGCLTGIFFYYGFDTNHGPNISLLTVALHEFAHGLGFLTVTDTSTGEFLGGTPDILANYIFDNTAGKTWSQMATDAERMVSAVNAGEVAWSGASATFVASKYLSKRPFLYVAAPPIVAGTLDVGTATFGAVLTTAGVSGSLVAALDPADGSGPSTFDACTPLTNASTVAGKIALIDRGTCAFTVKAKNAQNAGAIGVVIANDVAGAPPNMPEMDPTITIPVVSVSQSDGANLRANLPASVRIALDPLALTGSDAAGRVLLYTPSVLRLGSSVSHFDRSAFPNLLMEPNINADLPIGVDITPSLFRDIGWTVPPAKGDFNGDFYPDILWRNTSTGDDAIWYMNNATVIGAAAFGTEPLSWSIVGASDFDGDGHPDIVWRNTTTGDDAIWFMNGTTIVGVSPFPTAPLSWSIVGLADFNNDGNPDIVWRNTVTGDNAIWYMNGTTITGAAALPAAPTSWLIVGVADFNGDGHPDIVWRNTSSGDDAIWYMNGTTVIGGGVFGTEPLSWSIAAVADFNGDGHPDIVWRNTSTGDDAIWFMNGTTVIASEAFTPAPPAWAIVGP